MAKQFNLDLWRSAPVISLREYRRGWLAAQALWMACFNPGEQPPPAQSNDEVAFALGWAHYVKEQGYGK